MHLKQVKSFEQFLFVVCPGFNIKLTIIALRKSFVYLVKNCIGKCTHTTFFRHLNSNERNLILIIFSVIDDGLVQCSNCLQCKSLANSRHPNHSRGKLRRIAIYAILRIGAHARCNAEICNTFIVCQAVRLSPHISFQHCGVNCLSKLNATAKRHHESNELFDMDNTEVIRIVPLPRVVVRHLKERFLQRFGRERLFNSLD